MLIAIGRAFDTEAIDKLLFLHNTPENFLALSGDGVLQFARLVAADLAAEIASWKKLRKGGPRC